MLQKKKKKKQQKEKQKKNQMKEQTKKQKKAQKKKHNKKQNEKTEAEADEEAEEEDDVGPLHQAQMFRFHQDTPSISSSSKLDVKLMQSRTMIISTRLMAEPTFRL